ncbi:MAG: hypothetical protein QXE84_07920 [Candidatus Nitrosotenuis sp.]
MGQENNEKEIGSVPDLIPVRMLNEYVFCPRLAYIEWVENLFEDNAYTTDGRRIHRRVDNEGDEFPEATAGRLRCLARHTSH